jgi:hypothetical protein
MLSSHGSVTRQLQDRVTRLAVTPREVRFHAWWLWLIRLFIMPHMLIGIGIIGWFLICVCWLVAGRNVPGTITRAWEEHGKKGTTTYLVEYQYADGNTPQTGRTSVDAQMYQRVRPLVGPSAGAERADETRIQVRVISVGNLRHAAVVNSAGSYAAEVLPPLLMGLFWNGVLSAFFYAVWMVPYQHKALAVYGRATLGEVTGITTGKGAKAIYSFKTLTGEHITGSTGLGARPKLKRGPAIVLYDETRPKRNVLLEAAAYRPV